MSNRTNYEMTAADLAVLLKSMNPAALIALQCGMPTSKQENANAAWAWLGDKMNFDSATVECIGLGDRFFSAEALPPHVKRDGDKWCATNPDFTNLQESPAGFGDTPREAIKELISATIETLKPTQPKQPMSQPICAEVGPVSTPFTKRSLELELALCKRYFKNPDAPTKEKT